jgi:predicted RecB family endonuclease
VSTFNRNTLVKVLEILDSSHAQEALAAAKLASAMVREAGLKWDDVIDAEVLPRVAAPAPAVEASAPAKMPGGGPFGYRRERELSPHEQFFMVLLSPRTPVDVKRKLRAWEGRVLDGEITPQESADLQFMYQSFVVG